MNIRLNRFLIGLALFSAVMASGVLAADVGSRADVAAVRAAAHQKSPTSQTYGVHVVGDYALIDWIEGDAAGYAAFRRTSGERWKRIDWGGGATDVNDLVQHGVPAPVAYQLCTGWGDASPC